MSPVFIVAILAMKATTTCRNALPRSSFSLRVSCDSTVTLVFLLLALLLLLLLFLLLWLGGVVVAGTIFGVVVLPLLTSTAESCLWMRKKEHLFS